MVRLGFFDSPGNCFQLGAFLWPKFTRRVKLRDQFNLLDFESRTSVGEDVELGGVINIRTIGNNFSPAVDSGLVLPKQFNEECSSNATTPR